MQSLDALLLPIGVLALFAAALWKRLPAYELFVEGCKKGLRVAVEVLPSLMAMMAALSLMEASGLTAALSNACAPLFRLMGLPAEVAPLAFLRPLSGSAALAELQALLARHGADSRAGLVACTIMGSSETIVYTVCVYLGAIRQKKAGYAIPCAWIGMICGMLTAGLFFS